MRCLDHALTPRAAVAVALAMLCGCTAPQLSVQTDAEHATLIVDGVVEPRTGPRPFPYYGTIGVDLAPAESPRGHTVREPVRQLGELEPPAPEWLFPFDLPIEAVHRLLHGPGGQVVHVTSPERSGVVVQAPGPKTAELGARADRIRTAR